MSITSLRCVEKLGWLKDQEDYVLYCVEMGFAETEELRNDLQLIREIKDDVMKCEGKHD